MKKFCRLITTFAEVTEEKLVWGGGLFATPSSWIGLILSTGKYFEMSPRHVCLPTISESFALNLIISVPLANK